MFWEPKDGMRPLPLKHNPFNAIVAPRRETVAMVVDNGREPVDVRPGPEQSTAPSAPLDNGQANADKPEPS